MDRETTIHALHYIADSTVEVKDGGFHPTTIEIARDALEIIEQSAKQNAAIEVVTQSFNRLYDTHLAMVNIQRPTGQTAHGCELCEAINDLHGHLAALQPPTETVESGE